jgi:hypothetical protein
MNLQPLPEACARCGRELPDVSSGEMVQGVPGVGTLHAYCRLTLRQWLLHRAHRLLTPRSRAIPMAVTSEGTPGP